MLNGNPTIDSQNNTFGFTARFNPRPRSSVQGCVTTRGKLDQNVLGLFEIAFLS